MQQNRYALLFGQRGNHTANEICAVAFHHMLVDAHLECRQLQRRYVLINRRSIQRHFHLAVAVIAYRIPVSYTHLDVYKRQGLISRWITFSECAYCRPLAT